MGYTSGAFAKQKRELCQVPVAHTCNPSYSGGKDQEDHGLKPAWANSLLDPILKNLEQKKRAGGVAQGVGPEFKPQYCEKGRKKRGGSLLRRWTC
jgi:hypothetical protein